MVTKAKNGRIAQAIEHVTAAQAAISAVADELTAHRRDLAATETSIVETEDPTALGSLLQRRDAILALMTKATGKLDAASRRVEAARAHVSETRLQAAGARARLEQRQDTLRSADRQIRLAEDEVARWTSRRDEARRLIAAAEAELAEFGDD